MCASSKATLPVRSVMSAPWLRHCPRRRWPGFAASPSVLTGKGPQACCRLPPSTQTASAGLQQATMTL
eukprot:5296308-Alexandrium_andersonii.AAC.1